MDEMDEIYDEALLNYAIYVNFAIDGIYDEAINLILPWTEFMMKPIITYAIYVY